MSSGTGQLERYYTTGRLQKQINLRTTCTYIIPSTFDINQDVTVLRLKVNKNPVLDAFLNVATYIRTA